MTVHITISTGGGVSREGSPLPTYDSKAVAYGSTDGLGIIDNLEVPDGVNMTQLLARCVAFGDPVLLKVGDNEPWVLVPGVPLDLYVRMGDEFEVLALV